MSSSSLYIHRHIQFRSWFWFNLCIKWLLIEGCVDWTGTYWYLRWFVVFFSKLTVLWINCCMETTWPKLNISLNSLNIMLLWTSRTKLHVICCCFEWFLYIAKWCCDICINHLLKIHNFKTTWPNVVFLFNYLNMIYLVTVWYNLDVIWLDFTWFPSVVNSIFCIYVWYLLKNCNLKTTVPNPTFLRLYLHMMYLLSMR